MTEERTTMEGLAEYVSTDDVVRDACAIIEFAQSSAFRAVNAALVRRNWLLGKRIAEEELHGEGRAQYGKQVVANLSKELTARFGKGFEKGELHRCVQFYELFPNIVATASRQSPSITWSHYRRLLSVTNPDARTWYANEAAAQGWSVRTLDRNISTQYYERLLLSAPEGKPAVEREMLENVAPLQQDKLEFIKNPVVAEFLGLDQSPELRETQLESAIIANLQKFLLELGKGYAFVARQQHIRTENEDYFIDLVFYNYILRCFVLVDLKVGKITHQDVGQMDMYVRMYDERQRGSQDNPTLGIVMCSETNEDVMRYSVLNDKDQLYASKYLLQLPTQEQLRAEIERQKIIFQQAHEEEVDDE